MSRNVKDLTRGNVTINDNQETYETYNLSCFMRIADATEQMAKASEAMAANYNRMKADKDYYEKRYREEQTTNEKLRASNASLRGVITRMKNKENKQNVTQISNVL